MTTRDSRGRFVSGNGHEQSAYAGLADPMTRNQLMTQMSANAHTSLSRDEYAQAMLDPRREINKECGYAETASITDTMYRDLYDREAVATRVVEVLPTETWKAQPDVFEDEDTDSATAFEEAWEALGKGLRGASWYQDNEGNPVWEYLQRADVLSGIGHFGVLLLGIDDGKELSDPIDGVEEAIKRQQTANAQPRDAQGRFSSGGGGGGGSLGAGAGSAKVQGAAEGGAEGVGTHTIQLPKNKKRLSMDAAAQALDQMGYELGKPSFDFKTQKTLYPVTYPNGKTSTMSSDRVKSLVYSGVANLAINQVPTRKLLFLRAFDESLVDITQYEDDKQNPRYGQPKMYSITFNDPRGDLTTGIGMDITTQDVHWTRVIHLADNLGSSEIFGVPRMRPVFNRLHDLRKIYSGDAEAYWLNMVMKLFFETHPQLGGDVSIDMAAFRADMEKMMSGLQRWGTLSGMTAKSIAPAIVDPTSHIDVQIDAICILINIPKRKFLGSERGELASSQDEGDWNDRIRGRQSIYVTPRIIVPFIDRLIVIGVLPEPEGYSVVWPDLDALTAAETADIAVKKTEAMAKYVGGNVEALMVPLDYLTRVLEMEREEAEAVLKAAEEAAEEAEEERAEAEAQAIRDGTLMPPQQGPPGIEGQPGKPFPPSKPGEEGKKGGKPPFEPTAHAYNPSQPRDAGGKWGSGGGGGGVGTLKEAGFKMMNESEFEALDGEAKEVVTERLTKLAEDYPGLTDEIRTIEVGRVSGGPMQILDRGVEGRILVLDKKSLSPKGYGRTKKETDKVQASGFLAGEGGTRALVDHEVGHMIDQISYKHPGWKAGKAKSYLRKNPPTGKNLSRYAMTSKDEIFAEAFSAARTVGKPNAWQQGFNSALGSKPPFEPTTHAYNPSQPRDAQGKFGSGGGGGGGGGGSTYKDPDLAKRDEVLNDPEVLAELDVPETLYHVTSKQHLEAVKEGGLKQSERASTEGESQGVYLTSDPEDTAERQADIGIPYKDMVIVEVKTKDLDLRLDPEYFYWDDVSKKGAMGYVREINAGSEMSAMYSRKPIPAKAVKVSKERTLNLASK